MALTTNLTFIFRVTNLIFLIVALGLTCGGCWFTCNGKIDGRDKLPVDVWPDYMNTNSKIDGQWYVIAVESLYILLGCFLVFAIRRRRMINLEFIVLAVGVLLIVVAAGLEGWYSSGFSSASGASGCNFVIISWAIASGLLFLVTILSALDLATVKRWQTVTWFHTTDLATVKRWQTVT